ncbi:MAG: hypothetical protein K8R41_08465, partial [Bacteroidales bacterium]|nr:hypothetical protein [Bacteroidales bacterium]
MKKYLLFILIITFSLSCEKKIEWNLQNEDNELIYVDGIITNELKKQTIKLTRIMSDPNEEPASVGGAIVLVMIGDSVIEFNEKVANSGIYQTAVPVKGIVEQSCFLRIIYEGNNYTANSFMHPGLNFIPLAYSQINSTNNYRINWVAPAFHPNRPAMFEILLDWSDVPPYNTQDPELSKARLLYYTLPSLDVSEIFAPQLENLVFPQGTIIIEKRYSLTPAHAESIREVLLETNWNGGLFGSTSANVPTNLSTGAAGFFGACGVTVDTI